MTQHQLIQPCLFSVFKVSVWWGARGRDSLENERFSKRTYTKRGLRGLKKHFTRFTKKGLRPDMHKMNKKRPERDLEKDNLLLSRKRPTSGRTQNETVRVSTHILKVIQISVHIFEKVDSHKLTKWNSLWVHTLLSTKISVTFLEPQKKNLNRDLTPQKSYAEFCLGQKTSSLVLKQDS